MVRGLAMAAPAIAGAMMSGVLVPGASVAQPAAGEPGLAAIEVSWCSAPHDDYRRGYPVVDIRQFRDVRVVEDPQTRQARVLTARMRSAMVSAQTNRVEFVGTWVDYRFDVVEGPVLKELSLGLTLSLLPGRGQFSYRRGNSTAYLHARCGVAEVELVDKAPLPATIALAAAPAPGSVPAAAAADGAARTAVAPGAPPLPAGPDRTAALNRSHCLAMERTSTGFFGFINGCPEPLNYTYCILDATSANGRLALCQDASGEQLGEASGYLGAGYTAYLGMPVTDKGRVVWFACAYPGAPALTRVEPPGGRCR